jgi:Anti-sigma-K factor rskA/Putative zinc-finger
MITCQQCRDDLAEYDLGSADAARAEQVAAHLAACPACRRELEEVRTGWAAMPQALTPIEPSRDLFDRISARIDSAASPTIQTSRVERVLSYLVAAAVFIGLTIGLWRLSQPAEDSAVRQSAEQLARRLGKLQEMERLLSADDVRLVSLTDRASDGEFEGFLLWDVPARQWHFYANHLPPPPEGQAYQVWIFGAQGKYYPGPMLKRNAEGIGSAVVNLREQEVREAVKTIVTLEPATGSEKPTGKVFLEAAL